MADRFVQSEGTRIHTKAGDVLVHTNASYPRHVVLRYPSDDISVLVRMGEVQGDYWFVSWTYGSSAQLRLEKEAPLDPGQNRNLLDATWDEIARLLDTTDTFEALLRRTLTP